MEYSHNIRLENEEIVKDNKEITDRHHSDNAIEATHPSHPTQRILQQASISQVIIIYHH